MPSSRILLYVFIAVNLVVLLLWTNHSDGIDVEAIRAYLQQQNFALAFSIYVLILTLRGLTLLPGGPFLLAGIYVFSFWQVFIAIQLAIVGYTLIIYYFSPMMAFRIPEKIRAYEEKLRKRQSAIIFGLCFIPGISINILVYFLCSINIPLGRILTGILAGTAITSMIYIALIKGVFASIGALV